MDTDKLLQQYLDGELSSEEEKEALHIIAEDEELRSMLRFEQRFNEAFAGESFDFDPGLVPGNFSAEVMNQLSLSGEKESSSVLQQLESWFHHLWIPQQVQWRPVYAFVIGTVVLTALAFPLYFTQQTETRHAPGAASYDRTDNVDSSVQQVSSGDDEVMLRFVYIDENANSVAVAGDFTDWEPVEMTKQEINGKQVWTGLVPMTRGEHHYMFVKNGDQWITDPLATVQRDDGFGNKNAVLYL